jgi:hypothetical protein
VKIALAAEPVTGLTTKELRQEAVRIANIRENAHAGVHNPRQWRVGQLYIGTLGEVTFATFMGWEADDTPKPQGDGGIDFVFQVNQTPLTVDVKTAVLHPTRIRHLLREEGPKKADILVMAGYHGDTDTIDLLGWEFDVDILYMHPTAKDCGYGVRNHMVKPHQLRDMNRLKEWAIGTED